MKKYYIKKGRAVTSAVGVKADGDEITEKMFSSPEVFQNVISKIDIVEVRDEVEEIKKEELKVEEVELPIFEDEKEEVEEQSDDDKVQDSGAKKKK